MIENFVVMLLLTLAIASMVAGLGGIYMGGDSIKGQLYILQGFAALILLELKTMDK
jgi:hypothetical protein